MTWNDWIPSGSLDELKKCSPESWVDPDIEKSLMDRPPVINTTCRCTLVPWGLFVLVYSLLAAIAVQVAVKPSFFDRETTPQKLTSVRPLVLPDPLQPTDSMQHLSLCAFGDCTHHFGQGLEGLKRWTHPVLGQMVVVMMIDDFFADFVWLSVAFHRFCGFTFVVVLLSQVWLDSLVSWVDE